MKKLLFITLLLLCAPVVYGQTKTVTFNMPPGMPATGATTLYTLQPQSQACCCSCCCCQQGTPTITTLPWYSVMWAGDPPNVIKRKYAHAQQPKPDKPAESKPITLSIEASQRYIDLENRKAELRKQYGEVLNQQDSLLLGAQMAPEQRKAVEAWQPPADPPWKATDGMITFLPPKSAKAQPTPE